MKRLRIVLALGGLALIATAAARHRSPSLPAPSPPDTASPDPFPPSEPETQIAAVPSAITPVTMAAPGFDASFQAAGLQLDRPVIRPSAGAGLK
jgi:hypothetical protein